VGRSQLGTLAVLDLKLCQNNDNKDHNNNKDKKEYPLKDVFHTIVDDLPQAVPN
jgi:hypothetical protein